ncbi:MAG: response regulator [Syntrophaceae bacterium]|nr:response regulator [Syntrophaceae bacterium]HOC59457.1 response regulator [Smithellaceae bacterium]HQM45120.1 response regulator [Smithellaceae bacterium]
MSFNVLIVDDSNSMRAVIKKIVTISGFKMDSCLEAGNGRQAMELLADNWVDVIISDINMPEVSGLELLDQLSKNETLKEIPVIMITTEGSEQRMQEAFARGAKGFIKKPFLPEEIKKVLYNVIGVGDDGQYEEDSRNDDDLDF